MANQITRVAAWLNAMQQTHTAWSVDYHNADGSLALSSLSVTKVEQTAEVEQGDIVVESRTQDWLIDVADLIPLGRWPKSGDTFVFTNVDGAKHYFGVCGIGGEGPWRWHDREHTRIRVHSRESSDTRLAPIATGGGHYGNHFGNHYGDHYGGIHN